MVGFKPPLSAYQRVFSQQKFAILMVVGGLKVLPIFYQNRGYTVTLLISLFDLAGFCGIFLLIIKPYLVPCYALQETGKPVEVEFRI